jgi:predicted dehydrogenase
VSWHHPFKEQRLVVTGDAGSLVFDDVSADQKLLFYEQPAELHQDTLTLKKVNQSNIPISSAEPLKAECQHFLDCIQTRQAPETGIQNGINVLAVLQAAQHSLDASGKWIALKEHYFI